MKRKERNCKWFRSFYFGNNFFADPRIISNHRARQELFFQEKKGKICLFACYQHGQSLQNLQAHNEPEKILHFIYQEAAGRVK